ncbi:MAG: AarF/UbiB family protein [Nitrospirota bacterium]
MNTQSSSSDTPPPLWGRATRILWISFRILIGYFLLYLVAPVLSSRRKVQWMERLHLENAERFLNTTLSLKGLMIKVGQFMSARVDLLPKAYTKTLSSLQDHVPPAPFSEIRERIIDELGDTPEALFRSFNAIPLASASFGQVHQAVLNSPLEDGTLDVAVKIQYPHIEAIVRTDLRAIRIIVYLLQKIFAHIRFDILMREFDRMVQMELNYIAEAKNAEKFHKQFLGDDRILVPRVVWEYTTERVLTLTKVGGIKINCFDEIRTAGIETQAVARLLVESYMKQILLFQFFHGDPHPGNLFVQPIENQAGQFRLVYVDFGLMQEIDDQTDKGLRRMIMAIINRDIPAIARGLVEVGFLAKEGGQGESEIERVVLFFMDRYRSISPRAFKTITIKDISDDFKTIFTIYSALQVPNIFILAGRAVGMLNGICSQLDPDANIIDLAQPYAKKFAYKKQGIKELFVKGKAVFSALLALPAALQSVLELGHSGGVKTEMHSKGVETTLLKIYNLAYRSLLGLVAGAAIFYLDQNESFVRLTPIGILLGGVAAISSILFLVSFIDGFERKP